MIKAIFQQKKTLFIPFIMAGHPTHNITIQAILALAESGADMIELGVPFSDPVADGPINQSAAEIALKQGITLRSVLEMIAQVRALDCPIPIIIFSYLNPILAMGYKAFACSAHQAGANAVLVVDLPPEEGHDFYTLLKQYGLGCVLLTSPTTDPKRLSLYQDIDPEFIYYISRKSVTGTQQALEPQLASEVQTLRKHLPHSNIAVGFGISSKEQAATVAAFADGVIVGSLLVKTLEQEGILAFQQRAREIAESIHGYQA